MRALTREGGSAGDLFRLQETVLSFVRCSAFVKATSDSTPQPRSFVAAADADATAAPFILLRRRRAVVLSHGDEVDYANLTGP